MTAELIAHGDGFQIAHSTQGAQRRHGFVLRTAVHRIHFVGAFVHLNHSFALDRTGIAGTAVYEDGLDHSLAADVVGVLECSLVKVAGGEYAIVVEHGDNAGCAPIVHIHGTALIVLLEPPEHIPDGVRVVYGEFAGSPNS